MVVQRPRDPSEAIAILRIENASLEPGSLLEIAAVCNQAIFARSLIQPEKETSPTVWSKSESIPPTLLGAIEKINKKLLPSGEVDDSASPNWREYDERSTPSVRG
jgi:hypothetical protein